MALSGNLRDFSLPDVFQLISFSRKTGTLAIDRGDAKGFVYFRDGEVFFAISNWNREPMGRRLVRAEKVTDRQLKRALQLQESDDRHRRLGQIFVEEGFLSPKVLETFVQEQIQDTIFDLFRWEEGEFDFKAGVIPTEEDIGLSVSVENIIMEGSRRLEEWDRIRKKIPDEAAAFRMATAPGEGTFEISLRSSEWKLLCLLDGRRTIAQLSELLDMSDFEVSRILYGMFSGGLLERVNGDGQATAETASSAQTVEVEAPPAELETKPEPEPEPEPELEPEPEPELELEPEPEAETGPEPEVEPESAVAPEPELLAEAVAQGEDEFVRPPSAAEAASAGPAVEVGEPEQAKEEPEATTGDELLEQVFAGDDFGDDDLDAGDVDLTDELAALTGTSDAKPRGGAARARPAAQSDDVPLHVDQRINKAMVMKIIDGIKKL